MNWKKEKLGVIGCIVFFGWFCFVLFCFFSFLWRGQIGVLFFFNDFCSSNQPRKLLRSNWKQMLQSFNITMSSLRVFVLHSATPKSWHVQSCSRLQRSFWMRKQRSNGCSRKCKSFHRSSFEKGKICDGFPFAESHSLPIIFAACLLVIRFYLGAMRPCN